MRRLILALSCTMLFSALAYASTFRLLSLDEIIGAADVAIRGTVRSTDGVLLDGQPWTRVTFETHVVLADREEPLVTGDLLTLDFLGGSAGGMQLTVALMPQFRPGDEVLLLAYAEPFYSPVVGFHQGLWRLDDSGSWTDASGVTLGLDDEGNLSAGAPGSAEEVTAQLQLLLENR